MDSTYRPSSSYYYGSSKNSKHNGMIERSIFKKMKYSVQSFFSYLNAEHSESIICHQIVSFFRIMQLIGPAFFIQDEQLWIKGSLSFRILNFLDLFFRFIPSSIIGHNWDFLLWGYCALNGFFFILILVFSKVLDKNVKILPIFSVSIYNVCQIVFYLIHPIAMSIIGNEIGIMITSKDSMFADSKGYIVLCSFGTFILYIFFHSLIHETSIVFYHRSLNTCFLFPNMLVFLSTCFLWFFTSLSKTIFYDYRILVYATEFFIYCIVMMTPFIKGGFLALKDGINIFSISLSGSIFVLGRAIFSFFGITGNQSTLLGCFFVFLLVRLLSSFIIRSYKTKSLEFLDQLEENNIEMIHEISMNSYFTHVVNGFAVSHPFCLSNRVFEVMIEKRSDNLDIWIIYAKFVAIYPELNYMLNYIHQKICYFHFKGSHAKHIMREICIITKKREATLSIELKPKLNHLNKNIQTLRHKLRHIWDLAIQGSISDMRLFISQANFSLNGIHDEYQHLLIQYPNSRFVARSYARFLLEILVDQEKYIEWVERVQSMQKGIDIGYDSAHESGLYYFVDLPNSIEVNRSLLAENRIEGESASQLIEIDFDDEKNSVAFEQNISLRQQINCIRIPSTYYSSITRVSIYFFVFVIPFAISSLIIYQERDLLISPLSSMMDLSILRGHLFNFISFSLRYFVQELGLTDDRNIEYMKNNVNPPSSLGSSWNISLQFSHLVKESLSLIQKLNEFRHLHIESTYMDNAKSIIFNENHMYTFTVNDSYSYKQILSVPVGIMDSVLQLSSLFSSQINASLVNSSKLVNSPSNSNSLSLKLSDALANIILAMKEKNEFIQRIFTQVLFYGNIGIVIFLLAANYFQLFFISSNQIATYKCLTSLPKNIVSNVADSLKSMKNVQDESNSKTEEDSELNKQEENLIKLFATVGDSSNQGSHDSLIITICTIVSIICSVLLIISVSNMFMKMSKSVYNSAPHIDSLMGAFAYQSTPVGMIYLCALDSAGIPVYSLSKLSLFNRFSVRLSFSYNYYHNARFGKTDRTDNPFKEFDSSIIKQNNKDLCDTSQTLMPNNTRDTFKCISLEMQFYLVEMMVRSLVEPLEQLSVPFYPNDTIVKDIFDIEFYHVYDKLFYSVSMEIIPLILNTISDIINKSIQEGVFLLIIELIAELIVLYIIHKNQEQIRFTLLLLLKCPVNSIMQVPLISSILHGNFEVQKNDSSRDSIFFDEVLDQLPDPMITVNTLGIIVSMNKEGRSIFNMDAFDGRNITELFCNKRFDGKIENILKPAPQEEIMVYTDANNNQIQYCIKSIEFSAMTVFFLRDITQTVRYNTLIKEEQLRSDKILESILPKKLIGLVQRGEKNISFSVQSATIAFIDIVGFTPWCSDNQPSFIMSTLNKLYNSFDQIITHYPTITKIKCIGDCYMAAGGIFGEINQPSIHSKEMVEFCLEAIESVEAINNEIGQELRIRIGINTGGPLVAGVLGLKKPTFEILGTVINLAQQMESLGIPMQIHITRSVYELIYGSNFNVKERGQIDTKIGKLITYLVLPPNASNPK